MTNKLRILGEWFLVAMIVLLLAFLCSVSAHAQRTNTFYVDQFQGNTVAEKTLRAQAACVAAYPCVLIFDPSLANMTEGTMPARGANETWLDYRIPGGSSGPYVVAAGSLASAFAKLPATGGTVVVPANYAETLTSDLVIDKKNSGFVFLGAAHITLGNYSVRVTQGTHGVFFEGMVSHGGADHSYGARFHYYGTGSGFVVGCQNDLPATDCAVSSTATREFRFSNIAVMVHGAAGSTGIRLNNVIYFQMNSPAVIGEGTAGTFGMILDGTGNFTGTGYIIGPQIALVQTGIKGMGPWAFSMNAVNIIGGTVQPFVAGGIGLDLVEGDANYVWGTDFESCAIAIRLGVHAINTFADIRSESNTTDVQALAGSSYNTIKIRTQSGAGIVKSDAGTNNHIHHAVNGDFNGLVASTFDLSGTMTSTAAGGATAINTAASTQQKFMELGNTGNNGFYWGIEGSSAGGFFTGSNAYDSVLYTAMPLYINAALVRVKNGVSIGGGSTIGVAHHKRVAGCATAASVGAVCTTAVSWATAFADTNYTAVCNGDLVTSGVPIDGGFSAKAAGSITFRTVAATAAAAQYTNVDCIAFHD